jgi:uncharacterized PurR-regulated membrane protein YhhQ (DUF165 family)
MHFALLYVTLIVLANIFASLWMIPLPFGLAVPAGVFFIAPLFTLRDRIQIEFGVGRVYTLIFITALVSWFSGYLTGLALLERISIASVVAFVVSETLDTVVFSAFKRSFVQRVLISNVISTLVDSTLFIGIAFGWQPQIIIGQWIVKMLISAAVIPMVKPKSKPEMRN